MEGDFLPNFNQSSRFTNINGSKETEVDSRTRLSSVIRAKFRNVRSSLIGDIFKAVSECYRTNQRITLLVTTVKAPVSTSKEEITQLTDSAMP